ncbi:MAG: hypothetical protein AAGE52_40620 [Myxococcota bacterium]
MTLRPIVRISDELAAQIRQSENLGAIAMRAAVTIVLGAGLYGAVFGSWRGSAQAAYVALKLPLLLFAVAACAASANAILATLLGSRMSFRQSATCILLSLAVTAAILGALSPISLFLVHHAPPPDPAALGLAPEDPLAAGSIRIAQAILLWHVVVVAGAGLAGVVRLGTLLRSLVGRELVARRIFWSWLVIEGLSGAELSWLFRPFLGKPHLPQSLWRQEALHGNFFEEATRLAANAAGSQTSLFLFGGLVVLFVGLLSLRATPTLARIQWVEKGVLLQTDAGEEFVPWLQLSRAKTFGLLVHLSRTDPNTMNVQTYAIRCASVADAAAMAERLVQGRRRRTQGVFRTS